MRTNARTKDWRRRLTSTAVVAGLAVAGVIGTAATANAAVLEIAYRYLGVPYVYGGTAPSNGGTYFPVPPVDWSATAEEAASRIGDGKVWAIPVEDVARG